MVAKRQRKEPDPDFVSYEEAMAMFDEEARERLGMSGEEFIAAWKAGKIENPDRPEIIETLMLIPGARR